MSELDTLWASTGISQISGGQLAMIMIGLLLLFLAIRKGFEPLLLLPIGFGAVMINIPGAGFSDAPIYDAVGHLQSPGRYPPHIVTRLACQR